jgi:adenylate kinase family enzyme
LEAAATDASPLPEGHAEKKQGLLDAKSNVELLIAKEDAEVSEPKSIPAVKDKDKLNLVLIGPDKSGKTSVAQFLAQEHQRCFVKLDTLYDYCIKRNLPVGEKAAKFLEARQEELAKALEEQEKNKKAKGKKPPPKGQEEPEVNPADYKYLSKELVLEMIQARVREEDCNAGVVFDNLEAPQWPNLKFALEAICDALPTQNIQILLF